MNFEENYGLIAGFPTFHGRCGFSFPLQVQGGPEAEAAYLEKSESWDGDGPHMGPFPHPQPGKNDP